MEELDRHIKSQIESLHEVPGVEFDEKGVWKRIRSKSHGGRFYLIGLILLVSMVLILLPKNEVQRIALEHRQVEENVPDVKIDSAIVKVTDSHQVKKLKSEQMDSARNVKSKSEQSQDDVSQSLQAPPTKEFLAQTESVPPSKLLVDQTNRNKKEVSASIGRSSQTVGITHLKELDNRFTLSYGIQFNRAFNPRFNTNEYMFTPLQINQLQFPLGIRYNFFNNRDRSIKLHLYGGFTNSFTLPANTGNMDYNLRFESNLALDFRLFSTEDGKEGYLRFRLPLYNRNIINQGPYQPGFYDVLKKPNRDQ